MTGAANPPRSPTRACRASSAASSSSSAGPTPRPGSSSSSTAAARCTSRRRSSETPTRSSGRGQLGTFAGEAIADVLTGAYAPTGRLSHGLPIADGITSGFDTRQARVDRPAVPVVRGSASRRQRHHWCAYYLGLGARWPAAYTFGEGYTYTTFALSDWTLDATTLSASAGQALTASVMVTNTGERAGTETVHLYHQDLVCEERVPRLLDRLGHQQVTLEPGGSARLTFTVTAGMLAKYGRDVEAGRRVWPDRDPEANPDRLFLVQNEGQALDAIERFGDAPCVLPFTLVP